MALSRRRFVSTVALGALGARLATLPAAYAQGDNNTLRFVVNTADIATLDPHYASGSQDRAIVDMIFNGLVRFKPGDSSQFEPDLAEAMPTAKENSDGSQTWSFKLKTGVKTHATKGADAAELTVDDVVHSFTKAANKDTSNYAGDYKDWKFAKGSDGTFQITVPAALSETLFLPRVANYSGGYIVPKAGYEAVGADNFAMNPVGTGPFAFTSHTPQQNVMLTANADYFRGAPKLGGIDVRFIADITARENALQAGDVDVIYGMGDQTWVDKMKGVQNVTTDVFGVGEVFFININVEDPIFKDEKIREAVMLAIDPANHLALAGGEPVAEQVYSIVPEALMPGGLTQEEADKAGVAGTADIEKAKQLMKDAGKEGGFDLELITSEQEAYKNHYEVLAEELRQIGINVKLSVVEHAAMHEQIRKGKNAIVLYVAFRPTANTYLTQFFTTDGGVTNFSHFKVDDLVANALKETDADKQAAIWKEANIAIAKAFAGKGLMFVNQTYARSNKVDYGHELKSVVQLYPGIDETSAFTS